MMAQAMARSMANGLVAARRGHPRFDAIRHVANFSLEANQTCTQQLRKEGFTIARLGQEASVKDMESVAMKLMGLEGRAGGAYNGMGGVNRKSIQDTGFVDSSAGAPAEVTIQFHNEMAYATAFPKFVTFAMVKQAECDGTTTLADNLQVQGKMSAALLDKFRSMGVLYVRYLHDESESGSPDFYTSWQGAFTTQSLDEAMKKGNSEETFSSLARHDEKRLKHTVWCPVFVQHEDHGEVFFNSVLNRHGSWLDDHSYWKTKPMHQRPYHCLWGDGTEFSEAEMKEIRDVYSESTLKIRLDAGDVLVVDNLRVVHGRTPYSGSRLLGLLLSDLVPRAPCQPPAAFQQAIA